MLKRLRRPPSLAATRRTASPLGGRVAVAVLAVAGVLAACASTPEEHYFLLESDAPPGAAAATAGPYAGDILLNIAAIPESIDRPQLVLRRGANEAGVLEFDRWAEPVRGGIARVLAEGLGRSLPAAWVSTAGLRRSADSVSLSVSIDAMEALPDGDARLAVAWTLRRNQEEAASATRVVLHRHLAASTPAAAVAAWSSELAEAAQDIALAIAAAQEHKGA